MTGTTEPAARAALPMRRLLIVLGLFSALSAIGGGVAMLILRQGHRYLPPVSALDNTPFSSFLVPALILAVFIGGTSLLFSILVWLRSRLAVDATILAGGALVVWIFAEVAMMRELHGLHIVYGGLGLTILGFGLYAAARSTERRHRWVVLVTLAEAAGFLVPASTGIVLSQTDVSDGSRALLVVVAGVVEGLLLGAGQAWAFPLALNRPRFAVLTALAAGIVWASAMTVVLLATNNAVPMAALVLVAALAIVIGLLAIGTAQWLELRRHTANAERWIAWTALAWILALPASFAPGPFIDESTPLSSIFALVGASGLLMAYVVALVTWQGVRRLPAVKGASMDCFNSS